MYLYILLGECFTGLVGVGGDLVRWCGAAFSLGSPFRRFLESSRMGPGSGKLWVQIVYGNSRDLLLFFFVVFSLA